MFLLQQVQPCGEVLAGHDGVKSRSVSVRYESNGTHAQGTTRDTCTMAASVGGVDLAWPDSRCHSEVDDGASRAPLKVGTLSIRTPHHQQSFTDMASSFERECTHVSGVYHQQGVL